MTQARIAFVVVAATFLFVQSAFAAVEPTVTVSMPPLRTDPVRPWDNFKEKSASGEQCTTPLPPGRVIEQSSVTVTESGVHDAAEYSCWPVFSDMVDFLPGIREPRKACVRGSVKTAAGFQANNKRGHLTCGMTYRLHPPDEGAQPQPPATPVHDITSAITSLPADARLERDSRSLLRVAMPLDAIQFGIDDAVKAGLSDLPPELQVAIMDSRFVEYQPNSTALKYYVDIDITGHLGPIDMGVRCQMWVGFAIPAATADALVVQSLGTVSQCRTGSLLGQLAGLPEKINQGVRNGVRDALSKKLTQNNQTFEDWKREDPEWAALVLKGLAQGSYCDWRGKPGLCVTAGWRDRAEFNKFEAAMLAKVPPAEGPIDKMAVAAKLALYESKAIEQRQLEFNGVKFPSGGTQATPEDGDMGIFGGLLCRSGSEDGCNLIKKSRTTDGRFWRSPRRVNEADRKDHASFSGDQLRGVLHYFTRQSLRTHPDDQAEVKAQLRDFLRYLKTQPTKVPGDSQPLISGYSSCTQRYPNFTCLLSGDDWYALELLAKKHGLRDELPPDLETIKTSYGFSYEAMLWQSLIANAGYRLHLVGNTAWILRSLGESDPRIEKSIKILNARQPENPFFAYLLHGPDQRVLRLADKQCLPPEQPRDAFVDWAWQRADITERWRVGMVWDCVFIYGLLVRDPLP